MRVVAPTFVGVAANLAVGIDVVARVELTLGASGTLCATSRVPFLTKEISSRGFNGTVGMNTSTGSGLRRFTITLASSLGTLTFRGALSHTALLHRRRRIIGGSSMRPNVHVLGVHRNSSPNPAAMTFRGG